MPTVVLADGTRRSFDSARLRSSLVTRGLGEALADEIVARVEAALPEDAELPTTVLDGLVGNSLLTAAALPTASPDEGDLEVFVAQAFEFGVPGLEQAFVAGMLAGESPIARERLLHNPRVVLGMAQAAISGGISLPPFLVVHYLKGLVRWILPKLGSAAAKTVAVEAGRAVAERVGNDATTRGWKDVFKRLGVLGVEVLTFETLVSLVERILEDHSVDARKKERLRALLQRARQGKIEPDLGAEQIELIMTGDFAWNE